MGNDNILNVAEKIMNTYERTQTQGQYIFSISTQVSAYTTKYTNVIFSTFAQQC
jgi:hypothetical protein